MYLQSVFINNYKYIFTQIGTYYSNENIESRIFIPHDCHRGDVCKNSYSFG